MTPEENGIGSSTFSFSRAPDRRARFGIAVSAISLFGFLMVAYATAIQPSMWSDGAAYVIVSRNLLAGLGPVVVQASGDHAIAVHHPPLYALSLAAATANGADAVDAARWLNALLFATVILLCGSMVYSFSGSEWLGLAAASLILVFPPLVVNSSSILSEPLLLVLGFGSVFFLARYLRDGGWKQLALAAGLASLAFRARYSGAAFIGVSVLALIILGNRSFRRRVADLALYLAIALLVPVAWLVWLQSQSSPLSPRRWVWNFTDLWKRAEPLRGAFIENISGWIPFMSAIPGATYLWKVAALVFVIGVAAGVLAIIAYRSYFRAGTGERTRGELMAIALLLLITIGHIGLLSLTFLFTVPSLDQADINDRLLLPVALPLLLATLLIGNRFSAEWPNQKMLGVLPYGLAFLGFAWYLPATINAVTIQHENAIGFAGPVWRESETLHAVSSLPQDIDLISNESTVLELYLNRPAYNIPELMPGGETAQGIRFGDGPSGEERIFREDGAALILFDTIRPQLQLIYPGEGDLRTELLTWGLTPYAELSDGTIYYYPADQP